MSKYGRFITDTFSHWQDKRAARMGAAISYYAIFSIAPLFILLMAVVRTVFDSYTTNTVIARMLNATLGRNLAGVIQTLINSAYHTNTGTIAAIMGGAVLVIAALSVLAELNNDIDELWNIPSLTPIKFTTKQTVFNYIKDRFISLLLIIGFGLLFLFVVAFSVLLSFFHYTLPFFLQNPIVIEAITIIITLFGSTFLFAVVYRVLPDTKLPWRELFWGAFATAVLFVIGRFLIAWYIDAFGDTAAYGAAGSIVGLLLWIYYSAQVFFIGASGTFVYSKQYGFVSRHLHK